MESKYHIIAILREERSLSYHFVFVHLGAKDTLYSSFVISQSSFHFTNFLFLPLF
jgi:hypothetical protein